MSMTEWRLFNGDVAHVSTAEFHRDRERARHLEHDAHRPRLERAAEYVRVAAGLASEHATVSDLGCGDGGLLSLIRPHVVAAWGYDFCPANVDGWAERDVKAEFLDVFGADWDRVKFGTITTVTEVLEHLTDPHGAVRWIGENSQLIVASSPWNEGLHGYDECHAWAWDLEGYQALIELGGFRILRQQTVDQFQVILGRRA